ncbi:unnamed protein product [Nippostrongylus brasiliensis]|uniref:Addiction module toxin, HicA family n=1 Tax=Nippostrongylus brasiliensis TaxID=27835 RepID=A0A0N4XM77_NIPBR|nr:unnamed protein product [Nippostrongylus brasiliensis]
MTVLHRFGRDWVLWQQKSGGLIQRNGEGTRSQLDLVKKAVAKINLR